LLTLAELKEKVIDQIPEFDLVDLLGLTTEDLVNAFEEKLLEKANYLISELELDNVYISDTSEYED